VPLDDCWLFLDLLLLAEGLIFARLLWALAHLSRGRNQALRLYETFDQRFLR
jgi:hypothetical protein